MSMGGPLEQRRPGSMYSSVARVRASDSVVAKIQSLIVDQRLSAGDPLPPERELAELLAVSRNILREALGVLGQKGLIEVRPGRGTFVSEPSSASASDSLRLLFDLRRVSLVELSDARLLIEPPVAALAAENRTDEDLTSLAVWMERLHASVEDPTEHVAADIGFHAAIASAAKHRVFQFMVDAVRIPVKRSMTVGTAVESALSRSDEQHEQILFAIRRQDSEGAASAMRTHIEYVRRYLSGIGQDACREVS